MCPGWARIIVLVIRNGLLGALTSMGMWIDATGNPLMATNSAPDPIISNARKGGATS